MKKLTILAGLLLALPAIAADTYCVSTVSTITDANGVPLPAANQLIDRSCNLDLDTAFKGHYVRKGAIGALYIKLAEEAVDGEGATIGNVLSVYGR